MCSFLNQIHICIAFDMIHVHLRGGCHIGQWNMNIWWSYRTYTRSDACTYIHIFSKQRYPINLKNIYINKNQKAQWFQKAWSQVVARSSAIVTTSVTRMSSLDDIHVPGARFTNGFYIAIQLRWKFRFTLTSILIQWSLQNFVHGTTAMLSWHVPKFVAI